MEMASLFIAFVLSEFFGTRKWWRRFFIMVEISWKKVGIRWLYWFIFLSFGAAACCQIAQLCTYTHSIWNHFQENYQLEKRWRYQGLIETLQSFSESVSNGEFHLRDVYAYLGARVDAPSQQTNNKRKCQGYWKLNCLKPLCKHFFLPASETRLSKNNILKCFEFNGCWCSGCHWVDCV